MHFGVNRIISHGPKLRKYQKQKMAYSHKDFKKFSLRLFTPSERVFETD